MSDGAQSLSIGLLADTSNFTAQMSAAQKQLQGFSQQIGRVSVFGDALKSKLLAVGTAIAGAFAAKTALADYSASNLPGAAEFKKSTEAAQASLKGLSAAVGEYLAPAAQAVANLIKRIADPLTGFVRQFTALSRSAGAFLSQLGGNFVKAFGALVPTAAAAVNAIKGLFDGPATNWAKKFDEFKAIVWQKFLAILEFTAPIFVSVGNAIESGLKAAGEIASAVFDGIKSLAGEAADWLGSKIPAGAAHAGSAFDGLADKIQEKLIAAFSTVNFAFKNWQTIAETAWVAVELGAVKAFGSIQHLGEDLGANLSVVGANMVTAFKYAAEQIGVVFRSLWDSIVANADAATKQLGELISHPILWARAFSGDPKNANFALQKLSGGAFTSPDFSDLGPLPATGYDVPNKGQSKLFSLPGFTDRTPSDTESGLSSRLGSLTSGIAAKFAEFMESPLGDVQGFIDRILKGLPNITATPAPAVTAAVASSDKHAAAALAGSREAYSAILKATSGEGTAAKQLKAQLDTNAELRQIRQGAAVIKVGGF